MAEFTFTLKISVVDEKRFVEAARERFLAFGMSEEEWNEAVEEDGLMQTAIDTMFDTDLPPLDLGFEIIEQRIEELG